MFPLEWYSVTSCVWHHATIHVVLFIPSSWKPTTILNLSKLLNLCLCRRIWLLLYGPSVSDGIQLFSSKGDKYFTCFEPDRKTVIICITLEKQPDTIISGWCRVEKHDLPRKHLLAFQLFLISWLMNVSCHWKDLTTQGASSERKALLTDKAWNKYKNNTCK